MLAGLFCVLVAWAGLDALLTDARSPTGQMAMATLALLAVLSALACVPGVKRLRWLAVAFALIYLPALAFELMTLAAGAGGGPGSVKSDPRGKLDVIAAINAGGREAFPAIFPTLFFHDNAIDVDGGELHPLSGVPLAPTVLCQEAEGWTTYDSDRYGFNNPDRAWDGEDQIVLLGDSFTHGACLARDKTFPALLAGQGASVVNLGMSDDGPLLMLATALEYLPRTRPRALVWAYYEGNDLYRLDKGAHWRGDLDHEWGEPWLRAYLDAGRTQHLAARRDSLSGALRQWARGKMSVEKQFAEGAPQADAPLRRTLRHPLSLQSTLAMLKSRLDPSGRDDMQDRLQARLSNDAQGIAHDLALFETILGRAAKLAADQGARPVFLYLPSVEAFTRAEGGHPLRAQVMEAARRQGFDVVDAEAAFLAEGKPLENYAFKARGGHFSAQGHRLVARELLKALEPTLPLRLPQS